MKINKGAKVGIMMEIIVLVTMILLALFNKTIPSGLSWMFVVGLAVALAGTLVTLSKSND